MKKLVKYFLPGIFFVFLVQSIFFAARPVLSRLKSMPPSVLNFTLSDQERVEVSQNPVHQMISFIRHRTPENAKFLVFRQSDFSFYSERKFIRSIDPVMKDVIGAPSVSLAFESLQKKGIDYIYIPDYGLPTYYDSVISELVANPSYTKLVVNFGGYRLFQILSSETENTLNDPYKLANPIVWTAFSRGAGFLPTISDENTVSLIKEEKGGMIKIEKPLFFSGSGHWNNPPVESESFISGADLISFEIRFFEKFRGQVSIIFYVAGKALGPNIIWDGITNPDRNAKTSAGIPIGATSYRLVVNGFDWGGKARFSLENVHLYKTKGRNLKSELGFLSSDWQIIGSFDRLSQVDWFFKKDKGLYFRKDKVGPVYIKTPEFEVRPNSLMRIKSKYSGCGHLNIGLLGAAGSDRGKISMVLTEEVTEMATDFVFLKSDIEKVPESIFSLFLRSLGNLLDFKKLLKYIELGATSSGGKLHFKMSLDNNYKRLTRHCVEKGQWALLKNFQILNCSLDGETCEIVSQLPKPLDAN